MIGKIYVNKNIFIGKKGKYITLNDNKKKKGLPHGKPFNLIIGKNV
jgi:hypothetical protein